MAAARDGEGAVALIEGPPGIGKTDLLGALDRIAAAAGLEVLRVRGREREQGFAFASPGSSSRAG